MQYGDDHEIYHIGNSYEEIKIFDLAHLIINNLDQNIQVKPGEDLHKGGTNRRCPNVNKIASLGYKPKYNLKKGLNETIKWYIDNIDYSENRRSIE